MNLLKPPALTPGTTLGIVCPSYPLEEAVLEKTTHLFARQGHGIKRGATTQGHHGPFAGTPQERADDIHGMFTDPQVGAILCARGGYGANRVLEHLDFDLIQSHPKIFMGYSDITALLISITQRTGLVTFHGPMLVTFKDGLEEYSFKTMEKVLGTDGPVSIPIPSTPAPVILKQGTGTGPLWGGNLTLIVERLGTGDQLIPDGGILFLEEVDEYLYAFDRLLLHLRTAGVLDRIQGLIIGKLENITDREPSFGKTTDEIVMDICGDLEIPIISHYPCGHGTYQATLPLSIPVQLEATGTVPVLTLLESPVTGATTC
jgi:muramoyltetrapeptide carboxypeptidase